MDTYWRYSLPWQDSVPQQFEYLGLSTLFDRYAFVHESAYLDTNRSAPALATLIQKCKAETGRKPVLCFDSNPYQLVHLMTDLEREIDPAEYFVLSGNLFDWWTDRSNLGYWPTFLVSQQALKNFQPEARQGRISFISRIARQHRIDLWLKIRDKVCDDDCVVINDLGAEQVEFAGHLPWTNNVRWFSSSLVARDGNLVSNQHPAYSCCINITAETDVRDGIVFLSEKTWKAYKSGCMVINFGNPRTAELLEKFGFWIWDKYDISGSVNQKIAKIQSLFDSEDVYDSYLQNRSLVQDNQNLMHSRGLVSELIRPTLAKLE